MDRRLGNRIPSSVEQVTVMESIFLDLKQGEERGEKGSRSNRIVWEANRVAQELFRIAQSQ